MKTIILLIVLMSCSAVYAQTPQWEDFFTNTRQDVFYYDRTSIKQTNESNAIVSIRIANADESQKVKEHFYTFEIDCRRVTYKRLKGQIGFRDGSVSPDTGPSSWSDINYDSYLDALQKTICRKAKDRFKIR